MAFFSPNPHNMSLTDIMDRHNDDPPRYPRSLSDLHAQVPTARQMLEQCNLTQEEVEQRAYSIIMAISMELHNNKFRQQLTYLFPSEGRDIIPSQVRGCVHDFFIEHGYDVHMEQNGVVLKWDDPQMSVHDQPKSPMVIHTPIEGTNKATAWEQTDQGLKCVGVVDSHVEPTPSSSTNPRKYVIGSGVSPRIRRD